MSSLEIVWSIDTRQHLGKAIPDQGDLNAILSILDSFFPRLSRLHLALKLNLPTLAPVQFEDMLKTPDVFIVRQASLRDPFTVSITSSAFKDLCETALDIAAGGERPRDFLDHQLWRYLSGKYAMAPKIWSASL